MGNVAADLAFLKCILSMLVQNDDVDMKYTKIAIVIYNQIGPGVFYHAKAKEISDQVDPILSHAIAKGFMDACETFGKEKALEIFEINLREQIKKVTGQTDAELNKELTHACAISNLMVNGIHIDEDGGIINE